jgi:hypothetical protein
MLPTKIEEALDEFPVSELMKFCEPRKIEAFLAIELTKLASMVNIDNRLNLQSHQIPVIAQELLDTFSRESLADFTICFRKGAMGSYGEIYRLDGAIVLTWFKRYLDEKYQAIETRLMKEKDTHYQEAGEIASSTKDWVAEWKRLNDYRDPKKEDPNAYERERIKHRSRTYRKDYIELLEHQGLTKWAEWHKSKDPNDLVYSFKIEDQHIVAKDEEEARDIYLRGFKI